MSLIPHNSLFSLDNFFDNFFAPVSGSEGESFFAPRVDVKETDAGYEISAELPGVKKDDIHITLSDGVLSLEAETKSEDKEEKDGKVIRQERRYGKFVRSFNVGADVKESDIKANFENGVLSISTPKGEAKAEEKKRIPIG